MKSPESSTNLNLLGISIVNPKFLIVSNFVSSIRSFLKMRCENLISSSLNNLIISFPLVLKRFKIPSLFLAVA